MKKINKTLSKSKFNNTEAQAVSGNLRISPRKIRRVLKQIQGKTYPEALMYLKFLPFKGCSSVKKVLKSAASNALKKGVTVHQLKQMKIKSAVVNCGPTRKITKCNSKGKMSQIVKAISIVTITVKI